MLLSEHLLFLYHICLHFISLPELKCLEIFLLKKTAPWWPFARVPGHLKPTQGRTIVPGYQDINLNNAKLCHGTRQFQIYARVRPLARVPSHFLSSQILKVLRQNNFLMQQANQSLISPVSSQYVTSRALNLHFLKWFDFVSSARFQELKQVICPLS